LTVPQNPPNSQIPERITVRRRGNDVLTVGAVSLLARVGYALATGASSTGDAPGFIHMAREIAAGQYVLNAVKPSGTSLLMAPAYALGMPGLTAVLFIVLASACPVLLLVVARRLVGRRAAFLAALAAAVLPSHVFYAGFANSETPFAILALGALALAPTTVAGSGLLVGAAQWVRPTAPLLGLAMVIVMLARRQYRRAGVFVVCCALPVLPIVAWNAAANDLLSINSSQMGGWSLLMGTDPATTGGYSWRLAREHKVQCRHQGARTIIEQNRVARSMALDVIESDVPGYLVLVARKAFRFAIEPYVPAPDLTTATRTHVWQFLWRWSWLVRVFVSVLALLALVFGCYRRSETFYAFALFFFLLWGAHSVLEVSGRYRFPVDGFVLALASSFFCSARTRGH